MNGSLLVTCTCGCPNWVPAERQGQTVMCTACGNDLVAQGKVQPNRTFSHEPDALASHRDSRMGADIVASPFSLEMDSAPEPAMSELDRMEALRKEQNRTRRMFIESSSQLDGFTVETCAKCGKELRGEWDAVETRSGAIVCYVCSNQGTRGLPERLRTQPPPQPRPGGRRTAAGPAQSLPPSWRHTRIPKSVSNTFKAIVISLACLGIVIAFAWSFTVDTPDAPDRARVFEETSESSTFFNVPQYDELPVGTWLAVRGWMIVSAVVPIFVAFYFALLFGNSMPTDRFWSNLGYVAWACLPVIGIELLTAVTEDTLRPDLVVFTSVILAAFQTLVILFILLDLVDDSLWHCLTFVAILQACNRFAIPYLNVLLFRSLGVI